MKILSIGNSFSQDAQRYLQKLAANEGEGAKCVNLYIGGCSLYTHYVNMLEDRAAYALEFNGQNTGFGVSIRQALVSDQWDVITLQQASHFSFNYDTYVPYVKKLAEYIRMYAPKAKLMLHQTWAYEDGSDRLASMNFETSEQMFAEIEKSYNRAAEEIGADGIIPCGRAMITAEGEGMKVHRDTFHAGAGAGRYLLSLIWYMKIFGKRAEKSFKDFDVEVVPEDAEKMREIAERTVNIYK